MKTDANPTDQAVASTDGTATTDTQLLRPGHYTLDRGDGKGSHPLPSSCSIIGKNGSRKSPTSSWAWRMKSETSPHLTTVEVAAMLAEVGFDRQAEGEYSLTLSNGCTVGFVFDEPSPAKSKRTRKAV